jgi:hypothetical protein
LSQSNFFATESYLNVFCASVAIFGVRTFKVWDHILLELTSVQ